MAKAYTKTRPDILSIEFYCNMGYFDDTDYFRKFTNWRGEKCVETLSINWFGVFFYCR